jgi:type I restriction enzyme S subunit
MTDWPTKTFGELFESKSKSFESLKQKDYLSSGRFPVVDQGQELVGGFTNDQHLVRDFGDPVIVFGDHTRCVKYVDFPFVSGADGTKVLVPRKGVDPKFGYFQLLSIKLPTKGYARHFGELSKHSFVLPPLEQQKRIVELLDAATARITELTACYEQARTHANNLFTSALHDALESNPDWPVKTLGEVCEFQNGYAFRSSEYVKKGHALIRIKNVQLGEILPSDDVFVQIPKDGSLDQFVLKAGDILMSLTGYLGRVGRLNETDLPAALNQRVAKVGIKPKALILDGFLYRVLDSQWFRDQVEVYGRGAAQQNVGTSDISKIEIPLPSLEEQKKIVARLDSMRAKTSEMVATYDAKLTAAKNLRQSILEAAFGGDL